MRAYLYLSLVWTVAILIVYFVVAASLERAWRRQTEDSLGSTADSVMALLPLGDWQLPVESDLRWKQLESDLGVALAPVDLQSQDANGAESVSSESVMLWRETAAGDFLVSVVRPTEGANFGSAIRITQRVTRGQSFGFWRLGCLVTYVIVMSVIVYSARRERARAGLPRTRLQPWVESAQQPDAERILAEVEDTGEPMSDSMRLIAELVNVAYSESRSANERSELVFGNLREGVLAVDDRGLVLLANRALRRLLDLSNEPYLYRPLLEVVRTPAISKLVGDVLSERSPQEMEVELDRKPVHLRIVGRPLQLSEGRYGALLTVRDETLIKRAELIRRDFVANASHELKTPLAAIRAYAETLQRGALENRETAEAFVGNIISQADRIDALVQGMLQLSKVEVGVTFNFQAFDAHEAIQPCIDAAVAVARSKRVRIIFPQTDEPLIVHSDRDSFQTIVSNLLSNAVRYTDSGGEVEIALDEKGDRLLLRVRDTGIGMSAEDLERVFERFYRAEKDRSSDTGGTGLGLSIVKHLSQALGGSVSATSKPNEGSVFVLELPVRPTDA